MRTAIAKHRGTSNDGAATKGKKTDGLQWTGVPSSPGGARGREGNRKGGESEIKKIEVRNPETREKCQKRTALCGREKKGERASGEPRKGWGERALGTGWRKVSLLFSLAKGEGI